MEEEECMGMMMKRLLTFVFGFLTLAFVTTVAPIASQQSQTSTQIQSKSFVYKNIRITVTERGVVAGDLRTGKVVWRSGFYPSPNDRLLPNETRFFGEYLFIRFSIGMQPNSAALFHSLTGKKAVDTTDFYLRENNFYYFNNVGTTDFMERFFSDIVVLEFNSVSRTRRFFKFEVDRYFVKQKLIYCFADIVDGGVSPEFFKFVSKKGSIWLFALSNEKCNMQVIFDDSNLSKYSINVKRKNK